MAAERILQFEEIWNARDLGGMAVRAGGRVRSGRVLRASTLAYATAADCDLLARIGVRTVIDLRIGEELGWDPNWVCDEIGARHLHLPFAVPPADSFHQHGGMVDPGSGDRYRRLLEHNADSAVAALEAISRADQQPVLFHCAAGKDRTGLLAGLLLSVLDVDESEIVADYYATETDIHRIIARFGDHPGYAESSAAVPADYHVDPLAMTRLLTLLGGTEGVRNWLGEHGLPDDARARLVESLVDEGEDSRAP